MPPTGPRGREREPEAEPARERERALGALEVP